MNSCVFCKIIRKEIPSYTVYEDDDTIAFLDINQAAPGHTMVILKEHGDTILDYTPTQLGVLMGSVQKVAKKIKSGVGCGHLTIGINHLEPLRVKHLHVHLLPRWENDGGGPLQSIVKNKPKESLEELAEKIRLE